MHSKFHYVTLSTTMKLLITLETRSFEHYCKNAYHPYQSGRSEQCYEVLTLLVKIVIPLHYCCDHLPFTVLGMYAWVVPWIAIIPFISTNTHLNSKYLYRAQPYFISIQQSVSFRRLRDEVYVDNKNHTHD